MSGFVSLVGAGPGDPELLTLKAARRLAEADLVLYDALVSPEILDLASGAQRFSVGKRAGRPSIAQETIHRLMIRGATRGKRVVRLKCGDPFVLGRGGEEALALAAAGIAFEIVPGLTTAVSAPALSGIPGHASRARLGLRGGVGTRGGGVSPRPRIGGAGIADARDPHGPGLARGHREAPDLAGLVRRHAGGHLPGRGHRPGAHVDRRARRARRRPRCRRTHPDAPGTIVIGEVVKAGAAIAAALFPHPAALAQSQAV